ncbi:MAG: signal peptidase I [Acidobacteria bacterium]|nr:signal peptidase I [Acidobacteriota bacterium]
MSTTERRSRILGWRSVVIAVFAVVVLGAVIRAFWVDVYYIPSDSMDPLLKTGDRVLVSRTDFTASPIQRGDVVVFDGKGSFDPLDDGRGPLVHAVKFVGEWLGITGSDTVYVKRVIGVPGDHVKCCAADGNLLVNGAELHEPYVFPTDAPSEERFDVVVPEGKLWLMGDHRSVSKDSRALLGAPGGGLVLSSKVIGRPFYILWPLNRATDLPRVSETPGAAKDPH